MPNPTIGRNIDKATNLFIAELQAIQAEMSILVPNLIATGYTQSEIMSVLASTPVFDFVGVEERLTTALTEIGGIYETGILANLTMFGNITEEMLTSLVTIDNARFVSMSTETLTMWKQELARGIVQNFSSSQYMNAMSGRIANYSHLKTEVNTMMNSFSRSVTYVQAKDGDPNWLHVYEGPLDNKTRPICRDMKGAGEMTLDQVESNYPGAMIEGGGYNCRHSWERSGKTKRKK